MEYHGAFSKDVTTAVNVLTLCRQREDVFKHFRFTSRTTRVVFLGLGIVPAGFYYLFAQEDVRDAILRL